MAEIRESASVIIPGDGIRYYGDFNSKTKIVLAKQTCGLENRKQFITVDECINEIRPLAKPRGEWLLTDVEGAILLLANRNSFHVGGCSAEGQELWSIFFQEFYEFLTESPSAAALMDPIHVIFEFPGALVPGNFVADCMASDPRIGVTRAVLQGGAQSSLIYTVVDAGSATYFIGRMKALYPACHAAKISGPSAAEMW